MEQPWLNGNGDGFAPSEPRFNSRWYSYESSVAAGKASDQTCSHAPVKVLPILVGSSESLNRIVTDVKFGRKFGRFLGRRRQYY